jgi:tetratricopeptide (TPR) repeat protein
VASARPHLLAADVPEIVLDNLTDLEIAGFEELVNFAGLWGEEVAGRSRQQRIYYVSNTLGRSLYRLLLEVLKSRKVQHEIESLLAPLRADTGVRHFFTTAFIVSILGYNFWINDWQAFYKLKNAREVLRKHAAHVAHFVLVDVASIRPRSGVLSLFMVRHYIDDETIMECLSDIYEVAATNHGDNEFERAQHDLLKYSVVEPIFSSRNKLEILIKYFEEIRTIANTRNNPDYWLQMGIACTIYGDYESAQRAFDNAYSREKAKRPEAHSH